MPWEKPSPELNRLLEDALADYAVQKKWMFGCPAYFVNGNMMTGVFQNDVFIRLSGNDQKAIFTRWDEAHLFEPMKGRPMKEYVVLPEALLSDPAEFDKWLKLSHLYVTRLPLKREKAQESEVMQQDAQSGIALASP